MSLKLLMRAAAPESFSWNLQTVKREKQESCSTISRRSQKGESRCRSKKRCLNGCLRVTSFEGQLLLFARAVKFHAKKRLIQFPSPNRVLAKFLYQFFDRRAEARRLLKLVQLLKSNLCCFMQQDHDHD
jgi:hypothetical protein